MPRSDAAPRLLLVANQVRDFLDYRMALVDALVEAGFEVHVAVPREPGFEDITLRGLTVHPIPLHRLSASPWGEGRTFLALLGLYRRLRPAVVHHLCLKPTLYGAMAARVARVPAVLNTLTGLGPVFTLRTAKMRALRPFVAGGLRWGLHHRNTRVIVQNPDDLEHLVSGGLVPKDRVSVIHGSGVDLAQFAAAPEPDGPPIVLMASRLLWEKGVGEFVGAAAALRARGVRARFLLAGGPERDHPDAVPRDALEGWHRKGDVEWLGWRRDIPDLLARSHIVCLPSFYAEGIPRILIEAAACGRPIVTTDSPGCRETVRPGINGLLVPVRDTEALARALAALLADPARRALMGSESRALAMARFSLERVVAMNLEVHRSLAGGPLSAAARPRPRTSPG